MTSRVGPVARALGYAGLLPQVAAVAGLLAARSQQPVNLALHGASSAIALAYASLILSFLGGIWWGFAVRRTAGQGVLALTAVLPSLAAAAILASIAITGAVGWSQIGIGVAVIMTLLVDRRLVITGEAPAGWMSLRVPLSLGLGGLTILAGMLIGGPAVHP